MFELEWTKDISVGNEEIDKQHQHFFELVNRLIADSNTPLHSSMIENTLNELIQYAKYHFHDEEELLKQLNYPLIEDHIKEHQEFVYRIGKFHNDLIDNKKDISKDLISFLLDWIISHTSSSDNDYKYYINT